MAGVGRRTSLTNTTPAHSPPHPAPHNSKRTCIGAGSSGRSAMLLSSGSPGTICQWSNTLRQKAWPCTQQNSRQGGRGGQTLTQFTARFHLPPSQQVPRRAPCHLLPTPCLLPGACLRVVAQVCLEAKALHDRQERFDNEDGRARLRDIGGDVAAPLGQHCVDGRDAICSRWAGGRRQGKGTQGSRQGRGR
jgi:hypothetical protein